MLVGNRVGLYDQNLIDKNIYHNIVKLWIFYFIFVNKKNHTTQPYSCEISFSKTKESDILFQKCYSKVSFVPQNVIKCKNEMMVEMTYTIFIIFTRILL